MLLVRPASASDASVASDLLFTTGPTYLRYVFGLDDEARARAFLLRAIEDTRGAFSHNYALVAADESVVGAALAYPARTKAAIERAMIPRLLASYRPWEWPRFLRRGLVAQAFMEGIPLDSYYLSGIAVEQKRQGTGVAGRLLAAVFDAARAAGCPTCMLHVSVHNGRARAFYEREGFRLAGEFRRPEVERETGLEGQLAMVKTLG